MLAMVTMVTVVAEGEKDRDMAHAISPALLSTWASTQSTWASTWVSTWASTSYMWPLVYMVLSTPYLASTAAWPACDAPQTRIFAMSVALLGSTHMIYCLKSCRVTSRTWGHTLTELVNI